MCPARFSTQKFLSMFSVGHRAYSRARIINSRNRWHSTFHRVAAPALSGTSPPFRTILRRICCTKLQTISHGLTAGCFQLQPSLSSLHSGENAMGDQHASTIQSSTMGENVRDGVYLALVRQVRHLEGSPKLGRLIAWWRMHAADPNLPHGAPCRCSLSCIFRWYPATLSCPNPERAHLTADVIAAWRAPPISSLLAPASPI